MLRFSLAFFALLVAGFILLVSAQSMTDQTAAEQGDDLPSLALLETTNEQVLQGAELFDYHCADCHGDTAAGIEEAKLAFPEDHRHCTRCHKPNSTKIMANMPITPDNAFSVGDPPDLRSEGTLQTFPNAAALHAYTRATMPRYEPGRLSDEEYWALTAFLLSLHGPLPEGTLDANSAPGYELTH